MGVTSSRIVQSRRWLTLPDGWDTGWKAARATSATTPASVAVIGDSDAQGYISTNWMTKPFPILLRNALVAKYGSYADYWTVDKSARFQTITNMASSQVGTLPFTFDTTFGTSTSAGYTFNLRGLATTISQDNTTYPVAWVNAGSANFVTPYACTALDIIHHDLVSGTFQYNVDDAVGGARVTVTNAAWNTMRRIPITGLTNATHTVRFGASSVAQAMGLNGVVTYAPGATGGIGFANTGAAGSSLYDWGVSTFGQPDDRIRQWQGRYKTALATTVNTGFGFPTQPHLAIIQLGINDCSNSHGPVHFRIALRRMVEALRYGRPDCSVMIVVCPNPQTTTTDVTIQFPRAELWSLYADQIDAVAAEYQCAVANFHADWMPTPFGQGFTASNDAHPTDAGHQHIADVLASVIV